MMTYKDRESWIRTKICVKNWRIFSEGSYPNEIISKVEPKKEMFQIRKNWDIELYEIKQGSIWSVYIFEKSTELDFKFFISNK